ncbi:MAG: crossover junction endodeoxyribonuclease RuvC [Chloroflexi bacterium]|nr:MAG: crossover junction endodeoxyribonuclease RuvC [Chloroflexota bacterium]TMC35178.1 MAG: crossover junction endodeoxyribonuclease RuvC [Chloroflexota bacterium]TMC95119.1 MAG: crossover junction endodeoxyribonuclease RuvC [Chloroflexota bacterium]TMD80524.1 MAG: crossover junction endodeoxyribonuclease RuvC [Chloroflexota bacterium]
MGDVSPPTTPRIALGVDPGTAIVGYAVVSARGDDLSMIACDVITTPARMPLAERFQQIYQGLVEIIGIYHPQEAAIEELFFAKNARTAMTVGQARGVAMLALANGGLPISEYTPKQIKQAVTGYGSAGKEQVGEMVRILLKLSAIPRPDDAADAAAVAICHLHTASVLTNSYLKLR